MTADGDRQRLDDGIAAAGVPEHWYRDDERLLAELRDGLAADFQNPDIPGYDGLIEIGRGGQGTVFRATQGSTGRTVAIKVLRNADGDPEALQRFAREVELVAGLSHPGVVTVFDSGRTNDGRVFLVMELIEGVPFDEFAERAALPDIVRAMTQVAEAVHHAHQRGIIHRDLKPGNVLVDDNGSPHVLDFGLARPVARSAPAELVSRSGLFLGSLPWASPEQLGGDPAAIDVRSDVHALGVMLHAAISDTPPWPLDGGIRETIQRITSSTPARPTRDGAPLPPDLAAICLHALEKEPDRRYQSAAAFAADLQRFATGRPIDARPPSARYVAGRWVRRNPTVTALAGALLLGVVIGGALLLQSYDESAAAARRAQGAADRFEAVNEFLLGSILSSEADGERSVADAVQLAADAIPTSPWLKADLHRAEAHNAVAYWLSSLGNKLAAHEHHERAMQIRLAELSPDDPELLDHYTTLGWFRQLHDDHSGAITCLEQALAIAAAKGDVKDSSTSWMHRTIGTSRMHLGDLSGARSNAETALRFAERDGDGDAIATCNELLEELATRAK